MQERLDAAGLTPDEADAPEVGEIVQTTLQDVIVEIFTPKRLKKLRRDLQEILKTWMRNGNKYAGPLNTEIRHLEEEPPGEKPLIKSLYTAQIRSAFGSPDDEGTAENKPQSKSKRGRRGRRSKKK